MKTVALALLLLTASAAEGRHISQTSMGGDLEVRNAPDGASLRTMGGDIRVGNAQGRVVAKTMGGDIEVRQLAGSLDAGTMGGNVDVAVTRGDGNIEISSMGGHIELTLPADFSGTFELELEQDDDGPRNEIVSDFPLQMQEKKKNNWFRPDTTVVKAQGTSGTGANRVRITTIGGDIRIRRK
ncbi:MAG TPA: DUF4097 family beta strand repeat-containing protein [Thermoanaerobaculia bacterium]|nr:DUF4097 family beta strand repeat-containing protein [Thermoanaerobaculia bacterium]